MNDRTRRQIESAQRDYQSVRYPGRLADVVDASEETDRAARRTSWRLWAACAAAAGVAVAVGVWWSTAAPSEPVPIEPPRVVVEKPPVENPVAPKPATKPLRLVRARTLTAFSWPSMRLGSNRTGKAPSKPKPTPTPSDATTTDVAPPVTTKTNQTRIVAFRKPSRPTLTTPRLRAAAPKLRRLTDAS